jgi:hypothetical protein
MVIEVEETGNYAIWLNVKINNVDIVSVPQSQLDIVDQPDEWVRPHVPRAARQALRRHHADREVAEAAAQLLLLRSDGPPGPGRREPGERRFRATALGAQEEPWFQRRWRGA